MSSVKTYQGLLCRHRDGDNNGALFLSSEREPLAELLYWIENKPITVRYWVSARQLTKEQAQEETVHRLCGKGCAQYYHKYSELTGYLWTTQNLRVGGHDLMDEFNSYVGMWLILEIEHKGTYPKD